MNIQNRYFAFGDLHGHYDELMLLYKKLLKEANLDPIKDTLVFLGDYIDGGPDTKKVVGQMIAWEKQYPHWRFLYGNHEDLMLDALIYNKKRYGDFYLWWNQGGQATLASYKDGNEDDYEKSIMQPKDVILKEHIGWLKSRPLYFEADNYLFVHAGLLPGLTIEEHKKALDGERAESLSQQMIWIRDQFIDDNYDWGKKIIFGHTAVRTPIIQKNKIGIDTFPRHAGFLTAVELPAEKFYYQDAVHEINY